MLPVAPSSCGAAQLSLGINTKKQLTIALSSCEAEIVAGSEAAKDGIYYRRLLDEVGFPQLDASDVHMDNQGAINLSYNPEHHERTKHIARRHFFVRECVESGELRVLFIRSADNLADFFTKALSAMT